LSLFVQVDHLLRKVHEHIMYHVALFGLYSKKFLDER
jgi:hypothetical protein